MRIAFVTFEYPPFIIGGAGVYALNVTHELAKLGHQIVVFVPDIAGVEYEKDLENIVFSKVKIKNKLPFNALQYWLHLPAEVKKAESKTKFDIIHFNGISYWFLKQKISNAPHIITIHHLVEDAIESNKTSILSRIKNVRGETSFFIPFLEKRCLESADKIVSVSNFTKNQIMSAYGINPTKVSVIYNGINLEGYNFTQEEINETKKQFKLDKKYIILFVGRVNDPRKGLKFLLRSFPKVLNEFDSNLFIVGNGDQTELKEISKSLGIYENILFAGFVDNIDLKKCYSLCDVYVCSSRLEGFGLTILEAMAAGKPIVGTNVGAIPELIGDYGRLVDLDDENELAEAIITILADKQHMSHKNYLQRLNDFSWADNATKLTKLYNSVFMGSL